MKIHTSQSTFWSAWGDDPEGPSGHGKTEREAIEGLIDALLAEQESEHIKALSEEQRDAARYRWLKGRYVSLEFHYGREDDPEERFNGGFPALVLSVPEKSSWPLPWPGVPPERFDVAVDACIALEAPK